MSNIQVKNVPVALHRKLRAQAKRQGRTLRDIVLEAVRREVERDDFRLRLQTRQPVSLGRSAAESVNEARDERLQELRR